VHEVPRVIDLRARNFVEIKTFTRGINVGRAVARDGKCGRGEPINRAKFERSSISNHLPTQQPRHRAGPVRPTARPH